MGLMRLLPRPGNRSEVTDDAAEPATEPVLAAVPEPAPAPMSRRAP